LTRTTSTLHEGLGTFVMTFRRTFLKIGNVSDESCRESQNVSFVSSKAFRKACRLWDIVEECSTAKQTTDDNMAQRICKYTEKHTWYLILIFFPHDNNGYANAPVLPYTYVAYIVKL